MQKVISIDIIMILSGNPSTGARIENCIPKAIKVLLVAAAVIAADARK